MQHRAHPFVTSPKSQQTLGRHSRHPSSTISTHTFFPSTDPSHAHSFPVLFIFFCPSHLPTHLRPTRHRPPCRETCSLRIPYNGRVAPSSVHVSGCNSKFPVRQVGFSSISERQDPGTCGPNSNAGAVAGPADCPVNAQHPCQGTGQAPSDCQHGVGSALDGIDDNCRPHAAPLPLVRHDSTACVESECRAEQCEAHRRAVLHHPPNSVFAAFRAAQLTAGLGNPADTVAAETTGTRTQTTVGVCLDGRGGYGRDAIVKCRFAVGEQARAANCGARGNSSCVATGRMLLEANRQPVLPPCRPLHPGPASARHQLRGPRPRSPRRKSRG